MKAFLSCLQFGVGHQQIPQSDANAQPPNKDTVPIPKLPLPDQLLNTLPIKASSGDEGNTIIIPKPRKPDTTAWSYWMNYMKMSTALVNNLSGGNSSSSESLDSGVKSEGGRRSFPKLTKQERALKVEKYLEKKRRKNGAKKIRYQYRQELADKRIRFQGRFVKPAEAKDLIMQGVAVTVKDKSELTKLFEEDKDQELLERYNENLRKKNLKRIFKTVYDTSVVDRLSSGDHSSYSSSSSLSSSGSAMSPLIENMGDMKLSGDAEDKRKEPYMEPPPILKL
eukprot:TRINITY_DN3706_c0_g4_i7.p1 TRINITY_DN3706_c0_g4~~TRINITY_DN3706_c0_g4_i7.p1  ORF type:complete len:281 (+),score=85.16 TRINITY_DN3706_c0_g4_i7:171-1013(+)